MEIKPDEKGHTQGTSNLETLIIAIKTDIKYSNWSYW